MNTDLPMQDYIEELRLEYQVGRLVFDFIYVGAYDYLLSLGLVPAPSSDEYQTFHLQAAEYYQEFLRRYPRKLSEIRGEVKYPVDLKEQAEKTQKRITNYAKKYMVYDFIVSGRSVKFLTDKNNQYEPTESIRAGE